MPIDRERHSHRRVDVRTGEVAGCIDHRHDHQSEDQRDAHRAKGRVVASVGDDRAAAGEHEGKCRKALGDGALAQRRPVHGPRLLH